MNSIYSDLPRFELHSDDPLYPPQLLDLKKPPEVLYGIGDVSVLHRCLAVIGARKATPYGLHCAGRFAAYAASGGYTVVSGGAIGCDQAAHNAALSQRGSTVAVMGSGIEHIYPRGAEDLFLSIAKTGAVISELPWEHPPTRWAFRERNRIIAGLSSAVLIVEAGLPSGTFSTADHALDMGRDVFAVPGSILSPHSKGSNRLIAQGATAIVDCESLGVALQMSIGLPTQTPQSFYEDGISFAKEEELLEALVANPMRIDDIVHELGITLNEAMVELVRLEIAGQIVRGSDGRYTPNPVRVG